MATFARVKRAFEAVVKARQAGWVMLHAQVVDSKTGDMEVTTCIRKVKMSPEAVVAMAELLAMTPFI